MADGYDASGPQSPDSSKIEEYLTEYVDGTMEPEVLRVFEDLLKQDPVLAARARELKMVRQLLCSLRCSRAPEGFDARLRQRLAYEMLQEAVEPISYRIEHPQLFLAATLLVLLVSGLFFVQQTVVSSHTEIGTLQAVEATTVGNNLRKEAFSGGDGQRAFIPSSPVGQSMRMLHPQGIIRQSTLSSREPLPSHRVDSLKRLFYTISAEISP